MIIDNYDENPYQTDFLDTPVNRKALAEKILSVDSLNPFEKEFIYKLLVVIKNKSGNKDKYDRDRKLAFEEEKLKEKGISSKERIKILGKQFKLQGLENVPPRTYYAMLKLGKTLLAWERESEQELAIRNKRKKERLV